MKLFQLLAAFAVLGCHGLNINYDYTDLQLADFIAMTVGWGLGHQLGLGFIT